MNVFIAQPDFGKEVNPAILDDNNSLKLCHELGLSYILWNICRPQNIMDFDQLPRVLEEYPDQARKYFSEVTARIKDGLDFTIYIGPVNRYDGEILHFPTLNQIYDTIQACELIGIRKVRFDAAATMFDYREMQGLVELFEDEGIHVTVEGLYPEAIPWRTCINARFINLIPQGQACDILYMTGRRETADAIDVPHPINNYPDELFAHALRQAKTFQRSPVFWCGAPFSPWIARNALRLLNLNAMIKDLST